MSIESKKPSFNWICTFVWSHPYITSASFWTSPTHLISINTVLNVSKNGHFLDPSTQSFWWRNIGMAPMLCNACLWEIECFCGVFLSTQWIQIVKRETQNKWRRPWLKVDLEVAHRTTVSKLLLSPI